MTWPARGVAIALLACFALVSTLAATRLSVTYDEVPHLAAGYSYLMWGDYRLNPEHPPLVKKLAAIPLLFMDVKPRDIHFKESDVNRSQASTELALKQIFAHIPVSNSSEWTFGNLFLFGLTDEALAKLGAKHARDFPTSTALDHADYVNDASRMIFWSRLMIVGLGLGLGALIFAWSRQLFGVAGGLLSLALYCFDPNFMAHTALVTTDVGISLFMFGTMYFFWRTCQRLTWTGASLTVLFFSLAVITKFSAVLLVPMIVLAGVARLADRAPWATTIGRGAAASGALAKLRFLTLLSVAAVAVAYFLLWWSYDFRFTAVTDPAETAREEKFIGTPDRPDRGYLKTEATVRQGEDIRAAVKRWRDTGAFDDAAGLAPLDIKPVDSLGTFGRAVLLAREDAVLPESYLFGLAFVDMKAQLRSSYLRGRHSVTGFVDYFPWAFIMKTPVVAMLLMATALVMAIVKPETSRRNLAYLLIPSAVYMATSVASNLNIGHRHLLPAYPFLYVVCGTLGAKWTRWARSPRVASAIGVLVALALGANVVLAPISSPAAVFPNYLAYFNELVGGPRAGHRNLVDSNLDWGKDLIQLKAWLDEHGVEEPIHFCFAGTGEPQYYGIRWKNVVGGSIFSNPEPFPKEERKGIFAISGTYHQGVYMGKKERDMIAEIIKDAKLVGVVGYSTFIYDLGDGSKLEDASPSTAP